MSNEKCKPGDFVSFRLGPNKEGQEGPLMFGTVTGLNKDGEPRIDPQIPGNIPNGVHFLDIKVVR